jgi:uncharacterized protein YifE (UPF0438 family)
MECKQCNTSLGIQDLDKNEWQDDAEIFVIKCPVCQTEKRLVSPLFEFDHISSQYLQMIILDSKGKKEKYTNYIPEKQRKKLFDHISSCKICAEKIEEIRLSEISKELQFNEDIYKFFITKSKNVIEELDPKKNQIVLNGRIKSFVFEGTNYTLSEDNLFYRKEESWGANMLVERLCYTLEKDDFSIGMVSFAKSNKKVILEKIWLKSEQRIEKEKQFIANLRSGRIRILFELIQKLHDYV